MAISASFHRNVLLLTQVIQPSDEFKKHFREGMFDKPNTTGFLYVSNYLLTIYDSERFKELIKWPIFDKKSEAKYRNKVKNYLTIISAENPDIGFPNILLSHLIHAGGSKFTIIMWKLSQVVVRKYITRETGHNIICASQVGSQINLRKKFLQDTIAKLNSNILSHQKNLSEMETTTKFILEEEKEKLNKTIFEVFEKEELITSLSNTAPVHPSIPKRLSDENDGEVIKMWKENVSRGLNKLEKKNKILKDIEHLTVQIHNIIQSHQSDIEMLNAKQLQKINHLEISELLTPNVQCLLFQLYKDDKLLLNNFMVLFSYLLTLLYQKLKLSTLEDLSECSLQVGASCKDLKAALNIMQTYMVDITKMMSETQDILCQKNMAQMIYDDAALPIMNNMLIMRSPLINIHTNCADKESDIQKRLQLTPVEAEHKQLFSRYEHLKQNQASQGSKLRANLLVSRINFDDTIASINSETQASHMCTILSRRNLSSFKQVEKYSRLFSTRTKRNNRAATAANSSIMSVPCSSKANSTVITNAIDEVHDISELGLNISTKSFCNISIEFATPEKLNTKQDTCENTSEIEDVVTDFPTKTNVLNICETIQVEINNDYDGTIVKNDKANRKRRSIGDLVERYKKLLEVSNRTPSPKINDIHH